MNANHETHPITIRSFLDEDTSSVNALALRAWQQYELYYPEWEAIKVEVSQMSRLSKIGNIFVAERDGNTVGAVGYIPSNTPRAGYFEQHWGLIRMLVVDPDARGQGVGEKLTQKCLHSALEDGVSTIALHTNEMMRAALSLYLKLGFKRVASTPSPTSIPFGIYCLDLSKVDKFKLPHSGLSSQ